MADRSGTANLAGILQPAKLLHGLGRQRFLPPHVLKNRSHGRIVERALQDAISRRNITLIASSLEPLPVHSESLGVRALEVLNGFQHLFDRMLDHVALVDHECQLVKLEQTTLISLDQSHEDTEQLVRIDTALTRDHHRRISCR